MSLFGSSPIESDAANATPRAQQKSLFGDESTTGAASSASLFDDDTNGNAASPWDFSTPKKAATGDLVKQLLPASDVPESYIDAYDLILDAGDKFGAGMSLNGVKKLLTSSDLKAEDQARILDLVIPSGQEPSAGLGRSEFNVLLALIGLARENEDVTLDGVDERRNNLPQPDLPYILQLKQLEVSNNQSVGAERQRATAPSPAKPAATAQSTPKPRMSRRESMDSPDADPWASPATQKVRTQKVSNDATPSNGATAAQPISNGQTAPSRTTSAFTTHSDEPVAKPANSESSREALSGGTADGWAPYDHSSSGIFDNPGQPALGAEGFGTSANDAGRDTTAGSLGRSIGGGRTTGRGLEEIVTITVLPDKEGIFMFQHRNYEVKSPRRGSTVVRRYSDFVWLLDCLHKRYPFRQLPLLPPKRVAVNGRHLSSDVAFIEKRRRGLARFTNALLRHPILNQEQLVVMFLTVPTELAVWRKQATISVQEEFAGKSLPPTLEDSLPANLSDIFDTVREGIRQSVEAYINLCGLLERLAKRNQGVAADTLRFSLALQELTETSKDTYAIDTNDVPLLNEGILSTAKHLSTSQSLLVDEARAWDDGVVEDFKRQRDTLVSMRDMFDRRDRFDRDSIPQLERRIESNQIKLTGLKGRPEGTVKPGEVEKVEQAILTDKESIVSQHARGVFIKECIRDEIIYFQQSQYHVSKLHIDWSQERVKYAELQADNWRALGEEVEGMPLGE